MEKRASESVNFDVTQVYRNEIQPLINKIEKICYENRIPMFAAFATKESGRKTEYTHVYLSPTYVQNELKDDRLREFVRVIQGYRVVAPSFVEDIDAEECLPSVDNVHEEVEADMSVDKFFSDFSLED